MDEFAKVLRRPIELGIPSQAETRYSREVAERLTSSEYLDLHSDYGQVGPMKSLKISAGVHIRAAEIEYNGYRTRASFRVRDDIIEVAQLESDPARNWLEVESELMGVPFGKWERYLRIENRAERGS